MSDNKFETPSSLISSGAIVVRLCRFVKREKLFYEFSVCANIFSGGPSSRRRNDFICLSPLMSATASETPPRNFYQMLKTTAKYSARIKYEPVPPKTVAIISFRECRRCRRLQYSPGVLTNQMAQTKNMTVFSIATLAARLRADNDFLYRPCRGRRTPATDRNGIN